MTPEQHARAKELFLAACACSPERRSAFIEKACAGDDVLREHVEGLILHHTGGLAETRATGTAAGTAGTGTDDNEPEPGQFGPGALILRRYQVVSLLGRGGMGEVYLANDTVLNQRVALKFLSVELADDPAWIDRLVREVRAARRVTNPTVCRVFDIHIGHDGPAFITMEYVDGESLSSLLRQIGRFPTEKALQIARQICTGLCAAHGVGLLHRDLKPGNIMIDANGAARIMDFGLAAPRAQISNAEIRAGTPAFMAPELFAGTDVSVRSDIYALGLVLFELFAGRPAFDGQSYTELALQHQRISPPRLVEFVPYVPPAVEQIIRRCLEKDPQRRPESVLAVAAELPGTNPLAIAAAAGVTPTAGQVAGAGSRMVLPTAPAVGLLAALATMLGLVGWLGQDSGVWPDLRDSRPPSILLERARSLCDQLAPANRSQNEDRRFTYRSSEEFFDSGGTLDDFGGQLADEPDPASFGRLATGEPVAYSFWYRRAARALVPRGALNLTFGGARTSLNDPPSDEPGMTTCVLDRTGRLVAFEDVPATDVQPRPATEPDWGVLFEAAGVAPDAAKVTGTARTAPWYADQHGVWTVPGAGHAPSELRIEAAAFHGRPVHFALLQSRDGESPLSQRLSAAWRFAFSVRVRMILLSLALLGMTPLAWRNLRSGRGDPRGGARLAIFVACARLISWLLAGSHAAALSDEMVLLLFALLGALAEAGLVWIGYVAVEPHVRRHWPQTIISWTRVLAGEFRDPLVCRDVLLGTVLGAACALLVVLDRRIVGWMGLDALDPLRLLDTLDPLLGTRLGVAAASNALLIALYMSLAVIVLLVLACVLVRRPALAALLTALVLMPVYIAQLAHPAVSWAPLLAYLAIVIGAAMRLGLLAVVVGSFVGRLLVTFPLSFEPGGWALDGSIGAIFVISGLAAGSILAVRRTRRFASDPVVR